MSTTVSGLMVPSATSLSGGVDAILGAGQIWTLTFSGGALGDKFTLTFIPEQGGTTASVQAGAGAVTQLDPGPVVCFTYDQKVYVLAGSTVYFCALNDPTKWNDPNGTGNGSVTMANAYQNPEVLNAIGIFQRQLNFASRWTLQLWNVAADPASWEIGQIMQNTGTRAPLSMQPLGGLDLLYLSDSGIRSLRVRELNQNAFTDDIGSPVDSLVRASLIANPSAVLTACGIVEPTEGRYWLYFDRFIYVLSYFLSSKVIAWSKYEATFDAGVVFTIPVSTGGTITITVTALLGGTVDLVTNLPWNTNAVTTATDIATVINANTATTGYTAIRVGAQITLSVVGVTNLVDDIVYTVTPGFVAPSDTAVYELEFVPNKFVVFQGQVFCRTTIPSMADASVIISYGGSDNNTYDSSEAVIQTPWLDFRNPGTYKAPKGFNFVVDGDWQVEAGSDPQSEILDLIGNFTSQTFDIGTIPAVGRGTHQSMKFTTTGNTFARLSAAVDHYEGADEA